MKSAYFTIFFLSFSLLGQNSCRQCRSLTTIEAVSQGLLTEDLAPWDIYSQFNCPKYSEGDSSLCGKEVTGEDYSARLPNALIFSILYNKSQYNYCKDILNDEFLVAKLKTIPDPTISDIEWFMENNRSHYLILPFSSEDDSYNSVEELDFFQRKMIKVLSGIKGWTFCPERKLTNSGGKIHGIYNRAKNIILYPSACDAKKIYRSRVRNLSLTYKLHFVGAHEIGHAIDDLNGELRYSSPAEQSQLELRANVYGLIFINAMNKLFMSSFNTNKQLINNMSQNKACDSCFINNLLRNLEKVQHILTCELKNAKRRIRKNMSITKIETLEFGTVGCIEY